VFNPHRTRVRSYRVTVESDAECPPEPSVETYDVTVDDGLVVLAV
jgi:hypothetical protein